MLPRPGDLPVHQEAGERVGGLGVEQHGSEPFRQDLRPARVYEQRGVPRREEPDGRGGVGGRERRSRKIEQLSAVARRGTAATASARARARASSPRSRPSSRCPCAMPDRIRRGSDGRAGRALRRRVASGALVSQSSATAYRSAERRSHVPDGGTRRRLSHPPTPFHIGRGHAELRDEVLPPAWTIGQQGTRTARDGRHLALGDLVSGRAQPPRAAVLSDARGERPVVARRDHVDRAAHQRALDDRSPLQRLRQLRAFEAFEPRPQPDVGGRRVLRLHPAHPLDRPRERRARALQQHLPSQQGAVQLAFGQRPLGHRRSLRSRRSVTIVRR